MTNERRVVRFIGLLALVMIIAFTGCDTGNSDGDPAITVKAELDSTANGRVLTNLPSWTTAELRVEEVSLEYAGPIGLVNYSEAFESTIDLRTGTASPSLPAITLPPGTYNNISFELEMPDDGVTPSILLEGTWEGKLVRVKFLSGETFEAEADTLIVEEGEEYEIRLILNPEDWFSSLTDANLNAAVVGADGYIELSDARNEALFDTHFAEKVDDATEALLPGGTNNE